MTLPLPAQVLHLDSVSHGRHFDAWDVLCLDICVHAWEDLGTLHGHSSSAASTALLDIAVCHGT
jgi:hypothetical protein